jgi:hypothetical protein
MTYQLSYNPQYENNFQYRESLRYVFSMDVSKNPPNWDLMDSDLDDETIDELMFEGGAISTGMDYIYNATKDNTAFKQLYLDAAALMLSQRPDIGLSILFAYDYFSDFHNCLCVFFENKSVFSETTPEFQKIKKMVVR